jgi:hypothetical protein
MTGCEDRKSRLKNEAGPEVMKWAKAASAAFSIGLIPFAAHAEVTRLTCEIHGTSEGTATNRIQRMTEQWELAVDADAERVELLHAPTWGIWLAGRGINGLEGVANAVSVATETISFCPGPLPACGQRLYASENDTTTWDRFSRATLTRRTGRLLIARESQIGPFTEIQQYEGTCARAPEIQF